MNYSKMSKKNKIALQRLLIIVAVSIAIGFLFGITVTGVTKAVQINKTAKVYGVSDGKHSEELTWYGQGTSGFVALDIALDESLQKYTYDECYAYDIDYCFVLAMIEHESQFQSDIISSTKDYGLMQINEINHEWLSRELGVIDFLDPKSNIHAGVYVLRQLFEKYDDPEKVLMAYNLGEGGAKEFWDEGIFSTEYSEEILDRQVEFTEEYERKVTQND